MLIDLNSDTLKDADVAEIFSLSAKKNSFIATFDKNNPQKLNMVPDFGTVFIGFSADSLVTIPNLSLFLRLDEEDNLVETQFSIPFEWKQAHFCKRIGMFPSANQAMKNNFANDIPVGFSQMFVRINKLRGLVTFIKNDSMRIG